MGSANAKHRKASSGTFCVLHTATAPVKQDNWSGARDECGPASRKIGGGSLRGSTVEEKKGYHWSSKFFRPGMAPAGEFRMA